MQSMQYTSGNPDKKGRALCVRTDDELVFAKELLLVESYSHRDLSLSLSTTTNLTRPNTRKQILNWGRF